MTYYNEDINATPAPATDYKDSTDSFEEFKRKRAAREAAAGWSRTRLRQSAITTAQEIKDRQKLKR